MPAINKIRLTNVVYEEGKKRYNDELFLFGGYNGAILLENGGGKTVFIQTVLQAMIPHTDLADRKIKNTLSLENAPAHIAVEWILHERPRRYLVTAVTLYMTKDGLDSLRYVYEYGEGDENGIEGIPFVRRGKNGMRPAERGEMLDYYSHMRERYPFSAKTFQTIKEYRRFLEEQYHIIADEWESIVKINSSEGGVEAFFENCKSTTQLFDRLLIPTVEQAITGHDPHLFADMFEKQHDSLKQYKKLKETIEENKRIQEQLETYVQTFEKLHEAQKKYEKAKQRAKGFWEEIQLQKTEAESQQQTTGKQLNDWKQKQLEYAVKEASFQIARKKQVLENLKEQVEKLNAEYSVKKEELDTLNKDYYSLKFAKLKQELLQFNEKISFVEREMERLAEKDDFQHIEDELTEAKQALLGFFITEMEGTENEIRNIEYEIHPIKEEIDRIEKELDIYKKAEQTKRTELASVKTTIQTRMKDMESLKQVLLANPNQEQVETELKRWKERYQFLDEEIIRLHTEKKEKQKEQEELGKVIEDLKQKKNAYEGKLQQIQSEKERINNEQAALLERLGKLRPSWATLDSVYENEQSISNRLTETIDKLNDEKEELLFKERIAYRFVDDYGEQETFFSDPIIEKRLKTWKNQLDYCVTGSEYLQMLEKEALQEKIAYPLWAVTLITTNKSKESLERKITAIRDQLRFPIQIMSTEEAAKIRGKNQPEFSWMIPTHWQDGIVKETFKQWKEKIRIQASDVTNIRILKEKEIKEWEKGKSAFQEFIEKYPNEKINELHTMQTEMMVKIDALKRDIERNHEKKEELQHHIAKIDQSIDNSREEKTGLERNIENGNKYVQYKKEVEDAKETEKRLSDEKKSIQVKIQQHEVRLKQFKDEKERLSIRKSNFEWRLEELKKDEDYKELKGLKPIFTGERKKTIQETIQTLEMRKRKLHTSYGELKEKLENAKTNKTRIENEMDDLRSEYANIDEHRAFPLDGEVLLQHTLQKKKELGKEILALDEQIKKKTSEKDQQQGRVEQSIQRFQSDFPEHEIFQFTDPIEHISSQLKEERKKLDDEKVYLDDQMTHITRELTLIDEALRKFERFIEKHHFNAPQVTPMQLNENEKMDFRYNRIKWAKIITNELEEKNNQMASEQKQVEKQKQLFKQFCLTITDMKLQKMAKNGIEFKTNYDDLLDFKNNMMTSVDRAIKYANEHIRKKDEALQAYINQIHTHLKTVVEELKQIPKNTKVKVEDHWKTIYTFTIPEWDEKEGKQRIRDHIEWIMNQLQSDRYVKEDGLQDHGKIRKDIEMWLQTKQLLQIVMKNASMKVSCRKVTNENNVTTKSYSWEQTNVWSGGEKWSKNMTLFLGLLNYVAEKKQKDRSNLKYNRAVILDNPFGKASSDHVLSPVFFVAEQLGFQIIALTAHAEGKFLQDYFPVIYSCRLRSSKDQNKQIMTKEKWLHSAYFQDHEPEMLERLIETKQVELF